MNRDFKSKLKLNKLYINVSSSEKNKSLRPKQILDVAKLQDGEELHAAVGDDPTYLEVTFSFQFVAFISHENVFLFFY